MDLNEIEKKEFYDKICKIKDAMNFISSQEDMKDWNENIYNALYCCNGYIKDLTKLFNFQEFEDKYNKITKQIMQENRDKIKELEEALLKNECNLGVILKDKFVKFDKFIKENYFSVCDCSIQNNMYLNNTNLIFDLSCLIHVPASRIYNEKDKELQVFDDFIQGLKNQNITFLEDNSLIEFLGTDINLDYIKTLFKNKYPSFKLLDVNMASSSGVLIIRKIKGMVDVNCVI
jgi:hypothetical protein